MLLRRSGKNLCVGSRKKKTTDIEHAILCIDPAIQQTCMILSQLFKSFQNFRKYPVIVVTRTF